MEIHRAVKAEAQKVWPAKFRAVEKSWGALAENFDNEPHSLIVSRAAVKASVTNAWNKGKDLNQSVSMMSSLSETTPNNKEKPSEMMSKLSLRKRK